MDIFDFLTMVGGLALFLYGMRVLGDGLKKASGGKMEHILEKLTSNKLMAVLLGAGVTAVIQSSSATTVMVVGFVNSGIMKLAQATGVILGANVGTTVTAWILSLTEVDGTSFLLRFLKPTSFSPILAIVGVILISTGKKNRQKDIGTIIHYPIPPHLAQAYESLGHKEGFLPVTEHLANTVLSIPMYNGMTREEQDYVIDALNSFK